MKLSELPLVILVALLFVSGNLVQLNQSMSNHIKAVSLYNANDTILQLDYSNINATLFGKETAFFVEFYSSWCGHCIHFAPEWRKLAAETYQVSAATFDFSSLNFVTMLSGHLSRLFHPYVRFQWSKVMQMGAINCASEENFPVCASFEIKGFPTLKLFPARAVPGQKGLEVFSPCLCVFGDVRLMMGGCRMSPAFWSTTEFTIPSRTIILQGWVSDVPLFFFVDVEDYSSRVGVVCRLSETSTWDYF